MATLASFLAGCQRAPRGHAGKSGTILGQEGAKDLAAAAAVRWCLAGRGDFAARQIWEASPELKARIGSPTTSPRYWATASTAAAWAWSAPATSSGPRPTTWACASGTSWAAGASPSTTRRPSARGPGASPTTWASPVRRWRRGWRMPKRGPWPARHRRIG
jgi:hypothetical protein